MLAGQFGLAAAVQSREPQLPLWSLMLCAQLIDVLFVILYFLGIESISPAAGTHGGYGNWVFNAGYSHSLAGALIISLVVMIIATIPWGRRNGLVLGAVVFSHWIFDLLLHRADLPVLPGNPGGLPLLGFGLWSIPWLSLLIEFVLILGGAYLYYHSAMRTAVRAERQDLKEGGATKAPYRQQSLTASIVLLVLLVGTLLTDFFGILG